MHVYAVFPVLFYWRSLRACAHCVCVCVCVCVFVCVCVCVAAIRKSGPFHHADATAAQVQRLRQHHVDQRWLLTTRGQTDHQTGPHADAPVFAPSVHGCDLLECWLSVVEFWSLISGTRRIGRWLACALWGQFDRLWPEVCPQILFSSWRRRYWLGSRSWVEILNLAAFWICGTFFVVVESVRSDSLLCSLHQT